VPFGIGLPELLIFLVVVLLLFGASRVPEIGRSVGKGMREFKDAVSGRDDDERVGAHCATSPLSFGCSRSSQSFGAGMPSRTAMPGSNGSDAASARLCHENGMSVDTAANDPAMKALGDWMAAENG